MVLGQPVTMFGQRGVGAGGDLGGEQAFVLRGQGAGPAGNGLGLERRALTQEGAVAG